MPRRVWAGCALMVAMAAASAHAGTRRALIVGIDSYTPPPAGTTDTRGSWSDLRGAVNDARAIRAVLIARFGFLPDDVHVVTNHDATRVRILGDIQKYLIDPASAGDVSFFYYSGHGSQVRNSRSVEPDRMDETIVPADARLGARDIRDKEIAAVFARALDKQVNVTLAFDSCHSGSISRGVPMTLGYRLAPPDSRDVADADNPPGLETRGALVLSASLDRQLAWETRDEEGTPHGLFTWAFLKTLRTMAVDESVDRMFLSLRSLMQTGESPQEPVIAAKAARRTAPLFGGASALTGVTIAAVQSIAKDGSVVLQGGTAAGLRTNAQLRPIDAPTGGPVLRIVEERGVAESRAVVMDGSANRISPGALFVVTRWAAPATRSLRVWIDELPSGVSLALGTGTANDDIEVVASQDLADYALVHRDAGNASEYAWARPFAVEQTTDSPLPLRSDWIRYDARDARSFHSRLEELVRRLATLRGWWLLESPPDMARFPYHLVLKDSKTGEMRTSGPTREGESFGMSLVRDPNASTTVEPRYIYVFAVDAKGASTLLFPTSTQGNGENLLPPTVDGRVAMRAPERIDLGVPLLFTIAEPFGVDTYVLLTTTTALPNPSLLEGEGVMRAIPSADPLTRLLERATGRSRGEPPPTPVDWSIERLAIRSEARQ